MITEICPLLFLRLERDFLAAMNTSDNKLKRHIIINVALLLAAIFAIMIMSVRENRMRHIQQISAYIDVLSNRTAMHVSDVLQDREEAIDSIATFTVIRLRRAIPIFRGWPSWKAALISAGYALSINRA